MENVGQQGRTVLFVSHNMLAVTRLCSRAILLNHGMIIDDGPSAKVVKNYLTTDAGVPAAREWSNVLTAPSGKFTRILAVSVKTEMRTAYLTLFSQSNSYDTLFYGILDKFCAGTHSQLFHNLILMKFHCSWGNTEDACHLFG